MNEQLGLNLLSKIMNWDDEKSRSEFAWLRLMARMKYDGYRDFQAGMRFIESLACWLQQFETQEERETSYNFVRSAIVYISTAEMQALVKQFYPRFVQPYLFDIVARDQNIKPYQVLRDTTAIEKFSQLNRKILYMGLSDGARIDSIRRSSIGRIDNEQIVTATQLDKYKWDDLLKNLRSHLQNPASLFRIVYLIDDFMGTGTSVLRYSHEKSMWLGKITKFFRSIEDKSIFEPNWQMFVHHYIGTYAAAKEIQKRYEDATEYFISEKWITNKEQIKFTFGSTFPANLPINSENQYNKFIDIAKKYYNSSIETRHTMVGGTKDICLGYGGCALPVILEHNTPNNSISLLWAETSNSNGMCAMRPLFRRRQRHS